MLPSPVVRRATLPRVAIGPLEATSKTANWAGYQVTSTNGVRKISARWRVPSPGPNNTGVTTFSSIWVGIGGAPGTALLQAGSESDAVCTGTSHICSSHRTYLWYEIYPDFVQIPVDVRMTAGQIASASVSYANGVATLQVCNLSIADCRTIGGLRPAKPPTGQAEWIVERPQQRGNVLMLANFGKVTFSSTSYTTGGNVTRSGVGSNAIDMYSCRGVRLAQTDPWSKSPTAFSVEWRGYGTVGC